MKVSIDVKLLQLHTIDIYSKYKTCNATIVLYSVLVYSRVYGWTGVGRPGHITTCISDHNWCPVTPQLCGSPSSQLGHNLTSSSAEMWKKLEQDVRGHDKKTLKHET